MTHDTITINKSLIPYTFSILLGGELYEFNIGYNESYGFFTVELSKDGTVVCSGEKLVYGKPLFQEIFEHGKFPPIDIVPYDMSGENNEITFDNLSDTVKLIVNNQVTGITL